MKIWLSKPNTKTGKRHVVLDMTLDEERGCFHVLREHVIGFRGRAPKRKVRGDGTIRYRFGTVYLDRLMATFPYAELSPGLDRRARRATQVVTDEPVPELDLPDFGVELYDFQKIGVQKILDGFDEQGWFFLNDDLGLGKSIQALAVLVKRGLYPALIVCTNNAKWVWERFLRELTSVDDIAVIDSTSQRPGERRQIIEEQHDVTIINNESLRLHPELAEIKYKLLITDEFHKFKNHRAQQTKAWHQLESEYELEMSGTPILNRAEEAWPALHRVDPERWANPWVFERWLCIRSKAQTITVTEKNEDGTPKRDRHGKIITKKVQIPPKVVGYRPDRFAVVRDYIQDPAHSLRRRRDQVFDNLPEIVHSRLLIELTPEQRRLYKQIVEDMKLALENGEIKDVRGMLSVVTRAKQACFSPELYGGTPKSSKVEELREFCEQLVDSGRKALIGSQWSKATRILLRELAAFNPAYVDGKVRSRARMEQIDKFNNDPECHIYIGTIQANQEAITLSAATDVVLVDKLWSPLANEQFIGRSAAGGLRGLGHEGSPVFVTELHARDTIEQRIEEVLEEKRRVFNALVEKDGGLRIQRTTVQEIAQLF